MSDDIDDQVKDCPKNARSTTVPKQEDIEEEEGLSDGDDSMDGDRSFTEPELASDLRKIFIKTHADGHLNCVPPAIYEPMATTIAQQQQDILEKGLTTLQDLQEDGWEYVECLEEIREGLGGVKHQKQALWTVVVYVVLLPSIYTIGKFPYRPSNLFLKASTLLVVDLPGHDRPQIYCDVLDTLERDPLLGMVSPPLLALSGIIPLSIISVSAMYHQRSPRPLGHAHAAQVT